MRDESSLTTRLYRLLFPCTFFRAIFLRDSRSSPIFAVFHIEEAIIDGFIHTNIHTRSLSISVLQGIGRLPDTEAATYVTFFFSAPFDT